MLSLGLRQRLGSARFAQVVEPYPGRFMHHLEVRSAEDLDAALAGWLSTAYAQAA